MFLPDTSYIGESRPFTLVGNAITPRKDATLKVSADNVTFSVVEATAGSIRGTFEIPGTATEGVTAVLLEGVTTSPLAAAQLNIKPSVSRLVRSLKITVKGSKDSIERDSKLTPITALSVYGHDNGVVKEGTLKPPAGWTLYDVDHRYSKTLGEKDGSRSVDWDRNANLVRYKLTAKHGPYFDRWRNLTHLNITLRFQRGVVAPAQGPELQLASAPIQVKKGKPVFAAKVADLGKGDVKSATSLLVSYEVQDPAGNISAGAGEIPLTGGSTKPADGVVVEVAGEQIVLRF
jgi:hypothetical protein